MQFKKRKIDNWINRIIDDEDGEGLIDDLSFILVMLLMLMLLLLLLIYDCRYFVELSVTSHQ